MLVLESWQLSEWMLNGNQACWARLRLKEVSKEKSRDVGVSMMLRNVTAFAGQHPTHELSRHPLWDGSVCRTQLRGTRCQTGEREDAPLAVVARSSF